MALCRPPTPPQKKKSVRNNERKNGTGRVPRSLETFIAGILGGKEENEILFISPQRPQIQSVGSMAEGAESNIRTEPFIARNAGEDFLLS